MPSIERIDGPLPCWRLTDGDDAIELIPSRGGLVTSFVSGGEEVLYLDTDTLHDTSKNVRGGVPLLFPFAGKTPPGSTLPQHGFARRMAWNVTAAIADEDTARVECELSSNAETLAAWPHAFHAKYAVSLYDGRMLLEWEFTARGGPMPLHFGIHPYFRVAEKLNARVEGVGHSSFASGEVDEHFTPFELGATTLHRGDGSRVHLSWTPQFTTLVVWTLPDKPFICVEPWTAPGALPSPLEVREGHTERLAVEVRFER